MQTFLLPSPLLPALLSTYLDLLMEEADGEQRGFGAVRPIPLTSPPMWLTAALNPVPCECVGLHQPKCRATIRGEYCAAIKSDAHGDNIGKHEKACDM